MIKQIDVSLFSLRHTFESAQPLSFYADYNENGSVLSYAERGEIVKIMHRGSVEKGMLEILSRDNSAAHDAFTRFRLKDRMPTIYKNISTDEHISNSISLYNGMRLTMNDPWETVLTFIISQFNNVKRIRLITKNIVNKFGRPVFGSNGEIIGKEFPESKALLKATEKDFMALGAGFRSKYIVEAAEYCTHNIDLYKFSGSNYYKLKEDLMLIKGVGEKVADCIILMGYGNLKAFPIDVHVKRTVERLYFKGRKKKLREIQEFAEERWGRYRGYAQLYLFHNARTGSR